MLWIKANDVLLNIDKMDFMSLTPRCFWMAMDNMIIDGHQISQVKETKILAFLQWS